MKNIYLWSFQFLPKIFRATSSYSSGQRTWTQHYASLAYRVFQHLKTKSQSSAVSSRKNLADIQHHGEKSMRRRRSLHCCSHTRFNFSPGSKHHDAWEKRRLEHFLRRNKLLHNQYLKKQKKLARRVDFLLAERST